MTLDFKKLLKNGVLKQLTIQHVEIPEGNVQIFKREELANCNKVAAKMKRLFGDNILLGGDYWLFLSNDGTQLTFDKEFVRKTLFKVVNSALGNSANDSKPEELRTFTFDGETGVQAPTDSIDDVDLGDDTADEANDEAVSDVMGGSDELDESVENPSAGEKFVFLPILMK